MLEHGMIMTACKNIHRCFNYLAKLNMIENIDSKQKITKRRSSILGNVQNTRDGVQSLTLLILLIEGPTQYLVNLPLKYSNGSIV